LIQKRVEEAKEKGEELDPATVKVELPEVEKHIIL